MLSIAARAPSNDWNSDCISDSRKMLTEVLRMKRMCLFVILAIAPPTAVWADQVAVGNFVYYGAHPLTYLNGGPFDIYAALPNGGGQGALLFTTFCVERTEYLSNPIYVYSISDRAYYGGAGSGGDPIEWQTALIYYSWRQGTLPYPGNLGYSGSLVQQQLVQEAIWHFESELGAPDNIYVQWANSQPVWTNLYVRVLNTYRARDAGSYYEIIYQDGQPVRSQDQLVLIPEPATLFLAGAGLVIVFGVSRRRSR